MRPVFSAAAGLNGRSYGSTPKPVTTLTEEEQMMKETGGVCKTDFYTDSITSC